MIRWPDHLLPRSNTALTLVILSKPRRSRSAGERRRVEGPLQCVPSNADSGSSPQDLSGSFRLPPLNQNHQCSPAVRFAFSELLSETPPFCILAPNCLQRKHETGHVPFRVLRDFPIGLNSSATFCKERNPSKKTRQHSFTGSVQHEAHAYPKHEIKNSPLGAI